MAIGHLRERLTLQTEQARAIGLVSATWAAGLVSIVTQTAHGYGTGDQVTIGGATPSGYGGKHPITVTGATAFTYPAAGPLTTPATGTITATYAADTHGGRAGLAWRTLTRISAELIPLGTFERLQHLAIEDGVVCRFRVRARTDLVAGLRAVWTSLWPTGAPTRTLLITGVEFDDHRAYVILQCREVTL